MRALVIDAARSATVRAVPDPQPRPGWSIVEVAYAGLCGTDAALFDGTMPYLADGTTRYPLTPGHEWAGTVRTSTTIPAGTPVTGGTFIGCRHCDACRSQRPNLCSNRAEVGVRGPVAGAVADLIQVPDDTLIELPATLDLTAATFAEPLSTGLQALHQLQVTQVDDAAVWGTGTIGLLLIQALTRRAGSVTAVGIDPAQLELAALLGATRTATPRDVPPAAFDVTFDATGAPSVPADLTHHTKPGGRIALLGVPTTPVGLDPVVLVHHALTVAGILGGPARMAEAVAALDSGQVRTEPLVRDIVSLQHTPAALARLADPQAPTPAPPKTLIRLTHPPEG